MLFKTAYRIIIHEKEKFSGAVIGMALATFLMILQCGFYLGYLRDTTIVLDSVQADIWFVPKNQPLFDGWMSMDDLPYHQARSHPDVESMGRLVWGYSSYRLPSNGGKETVEVLGMDFDSGIGLGMKLTTDDPASLLRTDGNILIGRKDRPKLAVDEPGGDGIEIRNRRAKVVGFVEEVHLFTTAGFVLTDLDNGRAFLDVAPDHATYIVAKCRPGANPEKVARELQESFPEHEVMTTRAFHDRAALYWSTQTGIGPVLMLTAFLAILVGFLIVMLAFYVSTIEKIPLFACMKALGASGSEVVSILGFQVLIVFTIGCALAGLALHVSLTLLAKTTISVVVTPNLALAGVGATALCSALSSLLSIRKMISTDPGEAFRT
jgi:putative ABC transport system permease protein